MGRDLGKKNNLTEEVLDEAPTSAPDAVSDDVSDTNITHVTDHR